MPGRDADNKERLGSPRKLSSAPLGVSAAADINCRRMYDYSTLIQQLIHLGATFLKDTENRILHVPQDPIIAQKVYRFMLSDSLNKSNGSSSSFNTTIIGFEDGLRRLERLHDDFVETMMMLPTVFEAYGAVVSGFSSAMRGPDTDPDPYLDGRLPRNNSTRIIYSCSQVCSDKKGRGGAPVASSKGACDDLGGSININSSMHRTVAHKMILKEVKKMTYGLAPICDDNNGLEKKYFELKVTSKSIIIVVAYSTFNNYYVVGKSSFSE